MAMYSDSKMSKNRQYLPINFEPHVNDVLIGRGRRVETHNRVKFSGMISAHLAAYYNAQTKATKSTIILRIFHQVKQGGGVGFVKREASSKRWYVVDDAAARISIAQAFRDALSSEYKSSKQYKLLKRKEERGEVCTETSLRDLIPSVAASVTPTLNAEEDQDQMPSLRPPALAPIVSCPRSSFSRSYLRDILEEAASVVTEFDAESFIRNSPEALPFLPIDSTMNENNQDILDQLEKVIGGDMDPTSNPFEPTPIKETYPVRNVLFKPISKEEEDPDLFHVFDSLPAWDMCHALSA